MTFTVLLVDDNPVQAATRQAILTYAGCQVIVATSAIQALSLMENPELVKNVNLLITDHLMPNMNGPQLVAKLRQRFPTLSILVLSGMPDAENEYTGLDVLYCLKPIAPEELIRLTRSLWENDRLGRTA